MPAILTHDFFGRDMIDSASKFVELHTEAERDAFLLGNQGPDPLFYIAPDVRYKEFRKLGNIMHNRKTNKLLLGMRQAVDSLSAYDKPVGRAWAAGFLCHYALDSSEHPLIFSQQFAICDAGVEGLDRSDGSEVHAEIERDLDEAVLYCKRGVTIEDYKPYAEVLKASPQTLATIGKVLSGMCRYALDVEVPETLYATAVKEFRIIQHFAYSTAGGKRKLANIVEKGLMRRRHSFYGSMSHRARASADSAFDNAEHNDWENPFTGQVSSLGFWDIFYTSQGKATGCIRTFFADGFDEEGARAISRGLNFSGKPIGRAPAAEVSTVTFEESVPVRADFVPEDDDEDGEA